MDRMKTAGLILGALVVFFSRVEANEWNYVPDYAASPSANAIPTVTGQPKITCTLRTTLPKNMQAPLEAEFLVSGTVNGDSVSVFRYLFGDGESATGSGQMKHTYANEGTYQVRVAPMVVGDVNVPICKTKVVVIAAGETVTEPEGVSTPSAVATSPATLMEQPKTGPSGWYWASMGALFIVWLGAVKWYQSQRSEIG